jgi:hypothetical protein
MKYSSIVEALTEVRLDRAGDHVAAGVGHQAAHAGDLAHLHHVPSGAGSHHHVDRVELLLLEGGLHGGAHLVGGVGPDLHLLLAPLAVGDDAPAELLLDLVGLAPRSRRGSRPLLRRGAHVVDRHGETRRDAKRKQRSFSASSDSATVGLVVLVRETVDDLAHVLLLDRVVEVAEVRCSPRAAPR